MHFGWLPLRLPALSSAISGATSALQRRNHCAPTSPRPVYCKVLRRIAPENNGPAAAPPGARGDPSFRPRLLEPEQYTALLFTGRCEQAGISISMGSVGDCFDNAVCESFSRVAEEGDDPPPAVADPRRGALDDLPVHRGVVQPATAALHARVPHT